MYFYDIIDSLVQCVAIFGPLLVTEVEVAEAIVKSPVVIFLNFLP